MSSDLRDELKAFESIWSGGYFEGNPLDPMGRSSYRRLGYMSVLHATYLACIRPYVDANSVVLEIGSGRGAWTRAILSRGPREVWCLEAAPAETTRFWEYVGRHDNVHYHHVSDFSCSVLPDDHFTYFFSFGCFCHVSNDGVDSYMRNLRAKLKPGAHGFMMVGDFDKYNRAVDGLELYDVTRAAHGLRYAPARALWKTLASLKKPANMRRKDKARPSRPGAVTWHHLSVGDACTMLEAHGYRVIDADIGVNHRDPVIHFLRP